MRAGRRWAARVAGLSTQIHLVADRRCRPIARILSPGQHGDSPRFIPLMEAIPIKEGTVDVASIRIWLRDPGA
jgi:hypothetical protein